MYIILMQASRKARNQSQLYDAMIAIELFLNIKKDKFEKIRKSISPLSPCLKRPSSITYFHHPFLNLLDPPSSREANKIHFPSLKRGVRTMFY